MDATRLEGGHAPAVSEVLDGLNDLLQLDHDAIGAYDIAIEKLEDRDHADQILGFRRDHERHIRELNEAVAGLGGTPKNEPHLTGPFKKALQALGGVGGDRGLLLAFRSNELQVRNKYDMYAAKANLWPHHVKQLVDRNALDEERHYRWVADVLAAMGVGAGEGPELDAATRARERAMVGGGRLDEVTDAVAGVAGQVRDRAAGLAGSVRDSVAGGTGAVGNRIAGLMDRDEGALGAPVYGGINRVRGQLDSGLGRAREGTDALEERIRTKPLQMLLVAGIAGFVVGRLLR